MLRVLSCAIMSRTRGGGQISGRVYMTGMGSASLGSSSMQGLDEKKKKMSLKVEKDGLPPPIPRAGLWQRAPFLGEGDRFWAEAGQFTREKDTAASPFLLCMDEAPFQQEAFISPGSVLRLGVERGDHPYAFPAWDSYCSSGSGLEIWTEEIMENPDFCKVLEEAGIMAAVANNHRLNVRRSSSWLDTMLSRWSVDSHTFVTVWGEVGPTLEDVAELMHLPIVGDVDPTRLESTARETAIKSELTSSVLAASRAVSHYGRAAAKKSDAGSSQVEPKGSKVSHKNTFKGWTMHWYRDLEGGKVPSGLSEEEEKEMRRRGKEEGKQPETGQGQSEEVVLLWKGEEVRLNPMGLFAKAKPEYLPYLQAIWREHPSTFVRCGEWGPLLADMAMDLLGRFLETWANVSIKDLNKEKLAILQKGVGDLQCIRFEVGWLEARIKMVVERPSLHAKVVSLHADLKEINKDLDEQLRILREVEQRIEDLHAEHDETEENLAEAERDLSEAGKDDDPVLGLKM